MSLQEQLDELKSQFESTAPPEALAIMHRATDELLESDIMNGVLKTGERAPDFSLTDHNGNQISASDLLAKGPLVVGFYRGIWWRYCNAELAALQEVLADIEALGANLVTISPQLEKYSKQVARKHNLTFSVLGDPGNEVAASFGLLFQLPDDLRQLYQKFGIDFERFYGEDTGTLPLPARFILDGQGIIQQVDAHPDYTQRPEPTDLPKIISTLQ